MKLSKIIFLSFAFLPLCLTAQRPSGLILKTNLFTDIFGRNLNLSLEKIVSKKISVGFEGTWMRRERASTGGESAAGTFSFFAPMHISNGFSVGIFSRYYFAGNYQIPDDAFISGMLRYHSTKINGLEIQQGVSGFYSRTVDLCRSGPEFGFLAGRQFLAFDRISLEISAGLSNYYAFAEETYVSGQAGSRFVNGKYKHRENHVRGHVNFSIGYLFRRTD